MAVKQDSDQKLAQLIVKVMPDPRLLAVADFQKLFFELSLLCDLDGHAADETTPRRIFQRKFVVHPIGHRAIRKWNGIGELLSLFGGEYHLILLMQAPGDFGRITIENRFSDQ